MKLKNKKIGVWGLGAVGRSAISFLHQQKALITVCTNTELANSEKKTLQKHGAFFCHQRNIDQFFQENDLVIPSPGIDLLPYKKYHHKFLAELDLFQAFCKKPIIAITGSVGKTTITSLLGEILKTQNTNVLVGGNIGIPALDLLSQQKNADYILLEVSSFQLEYCKSFAPYLAIITNVYANHLDRHKTMKSYLDAKLNILKYQNKNQKALLPFNLVEKTPKNIQSAISFFSDDRNQKTFPLSLRTFFFFMVKIVAIMRHNGQEEGLADISHFPPITFVQNWLIITAALHLLGKKLETKDVRQKFILPEHRLEKVGTIKGVTFYNDSKATTPASTLAAVNQLQNAPIHLFLGGLSKGVDRANLVKQLKNKVCFIYCFGKEAEQLYTMCTQENIPTQAFCNLDDAFQASVKKARPGQQILLSPGGSSFDLFKNYQERGNYFKKCVSMLFS